MKRFYKLVSISGNQKGGWQILLDEKPVRTPAGAVLAVPSQPLAGAIMAEWARQKSQIDPPSMPLTQILVTAIDRIPAHRAEMESAALAYLDTDLLCYRAERPAGLVAHQAALWDPPLAWFEKKYSVALETTAGLKALEQPQEAHEGARAAIAALDDYTFSVVQLAVSLTGSLVLALAFLDGAALADDLYNAVLVEENWKAAIYKEDIYGAAPHEERKNETLMRDLVAAKEFLQALR